MKKKYIIISIMLSFVILLTGTYAYLTWQSEENTNFTLSLGEVGEVLFSGGNEISSNGIGPVLTPEEGVYTEFQILKKTDTSFTVTIDFLPSTLPEELKEESFKYALYKKESENDTYTLIREDSFEDKVQGTQFTITEEEITSTTYYKLIIYIDGNMSNPSDMQGKDFAGTIIVSYEQKIPASEILTSIYANATKTNVVNNGVTYEYANDASMMTDIDGNIRYYGADPDNYIYFNCETYPATNCEKWRIIGIFDGKIKIMRNESIGTYSWDTSVSTVNTGYGINQWGESTYSTDASTYYGADLMKLLNPGYESNQDLNSAGSTIAVNNSLYYNSESGNCYVNGYSIASSCDFTSNGLKDNENNETKNMISDTTYYLGGYNSFSVYANQIYTYERGDSFGISSTDNVVRTGIWTGKIGLPYVSDYGYAVDLNSCKVTMNSYSDPTCTSTNWMQSIFSSTYNWLITPKSGTTNNVWRVDKNGYADMSTVVYTASGVVPTLYLDSSVIIDPEVGTGDVDDPYRIVIS